MTTGDRYFMFALTLFVVGMIYRSDAEYFWWLIYMLGTLVFTYLAKRHDKKDEEKEQK